MGFIGRLWRGEVSLGATYWIFGALVVFMFQVFEAATALPPEGPGELGVFISTAYYFFISIAILRSSMRHTGSRMFIVWTQLSVVSLWLLVLWRIIIAASGVVEGIAP